jgi:hypothetical protein
MQRGCYYDGFTSLIEEQSKNEDRDKSSSVHVMSQIYYYKVSNIERNQTARWWHRNPSASAGFSLSTATSRGLFTAIKAQTGRMRHGDRLIGGT